MKIPRTRLLHLALWAFLSMFLAAAVNTASQAASPEDPTAVARDFYAWYLGELKGNRDPIDDERPSLERYVAPSLVAEIAKMMESPDGIDEDYFIKAQDYLDGWLGHVTTTHASLIGDSATTVVTLGRAKSDLWRLRVVLTRNPAGRVADSPCREGLVVSNLLLALRQPWRVQVRGVCDAHYGSGWHLRFPPKHPPRKGGAPS